MDTDIDYLIQDLDKCALLLDAAFEALHSHSVNSVASILTDLRGHIAEMRDAATGVHEDDEKA